MALCSFRTVIPNYAKFLISVIALLFSFNGYSAKTELPMNISSPLAAHYHLVDGFEEPLVATIATTKEEDLALKQAITNYQKRALPENVSAFNEFIKNYPKSGWNVSILTNLGLIYYHHGYFSKAIEAWEQAWQIEKNQPTDNPIAKMMADRAIGELARMHARLGHAPQLESFFQDIGDRPVTGPATESLAGAREGLWSMLNNPGVAYLCGPMALKNLLLIGGASPVDIAFIDQVRSGPQGMTLAEVSELANKAKLPYSLIFREADQPIPIPSIVHWKVNHFAAIVAEIDGRLQIKDPTFGNDLWITRAAFETESSGYFLIPEQTDTVPSWRQVSIEEASHVRGMGNTGNNDPTATKPDDIKTKPDCNNMGMCGYNIHEMVVSLNLTDTPVGYAPPIGPAAYVTLTYNQREANQPAVFSWFNIGPKWTLNWLSYIQDNPSVPSANVMRYVAGGGSVNYTGYNITTGAYAPERADASMLVRTSTDPIIYERRLANGAREIYAHANGAKASPRRIFLTQVIDSAGNDVTLTYDDQLRLTALVDATGRSTTFTYGMSTHPLLITEITDPFGRSAFIEYDDSGRLIRIIDVMGLASEFTYDASSLIDSLTTPYGTTRFAFGGTGNFRWLNVTDPLGQTERVEYRHTAPGISYSEPSQAIPQGMQTFNAYLNYRNSFYWDKHAYKIAAGDYTKARMRHWTHLATSTNFTANTLESTKNPLENRVWFNYPGQSTSSSGTAFSGNFDKPNRVGRVLDDGTTQLTQFEYNSLGQVIRTIDPVGRETQFEYDINQIDLLKIKQKTSVSDYSIIAEFTYNDQHLPLTYLDASGQTTTYSYNSFGLPSQVTDALGQTTSFEYDGFGYLNRIINPNNQTTTSFTYDNYGRIATQTDSEGYTLTYNYDNFDRVIQITYPDGTTTEYSYDKLDLVATTDRLGRTTSFSYDANRRMTSMTDPLGQVTHYSYYENGVLKSITDAEGNITYWNIDIQNRPMAKFYADNSVEKYTYEAKSGRLKAITDALGQMKQYGYAKDNRIADLSYLNSQQSMANVSFSYDQFFPRRVAMIDGNGTTQFHYGTVGSLGALKLIKEDGPYTNDDITYQYDALGRMASRKVNTATESFTYDRLDRVKTRINPLGTFNFGYLGQTNQILGQQSGNVGTNWSYETNSNDRRLQTITNSGIARSFQYTTTPENQISSLTELVSGAPQKIWNYVYDNNDRLTRSHSSTGIAYNYDYDAADNLISINGAPASYNSANQLVSFNGTTFVYDANGNLIEDDTRTYQWDAENRLLSIGYKSQPGKTTSFRYDGMGRRLAIIESNGIATNETRYLWCGDSLCQARTSEDVVTRHYYPEGVAIPQGGTLLYYGKDHLGSVRDVLVAQNGSKVASYDYDPYGNHIASSGRISVDFRYAGMFYHQTSGLYLTNFRAYDPKTARWLSRDPIGEVGGLNLYGYVDGNPVNEIDLYGLKKWNPYKLKKKKDQLISSIAQNIKNYPKNIIKKESTKVIIGTQGGYLLPDDVYDSIFSIAWSLRVDCAKGLGLGCVWGLGNETGKAVHNLTVGYYDITYENDGCTTKGLGGWAGKTDSILDNYPAIENIANGIIDSRNTISNSISNFENSISNFMSSVPQNQNSSTFHYNFPTRVSPYTWGELMFVP